MVMIIIYRDNYHCGALLLRLLSAVLLGDESAELLGHIGAHGAMLGACAGVAGRRRAFPLIA